MSNDEILERAEKISERFKTSNLPMTAEEKDIVDRAYEIKVWRMVDETQSAFGYNYVTD